MAIQYCKKKVKVKKLSDEWKPLSINEMVEFAESVVNKISSKPPVIKSVCPKCYGLGEIQITTDNRFTCTKCCGTGQTVL